MIPNPLPATLDDPEPFYPRPGRKLPAGPAGRKVRTRDCRRCVILRSLVEAGLPAATTNAICRRMRLNRVRRQQILFSEGNRPVHLYAIRRGKVKLLKMEADGREHVTAVLTAGDLFGFEAVFGDAYRTGAEMLTDGELCLAWGEELKVLMARVPRVAIDLARYLHHQLERALERQSCTTASGSQAKLAAFLLHELATRPRDDRESIVCQDLTLKDLGGILGLSPETVCRALGALKDCGVSRLHPGILVRDRLALERLVTG